MERTLFIGSVDLGANLGLPGYMFCDLGTSFNSSEPQLADQEKGPIVHPKEGWWGAIKGMMAMKMLWE